MTTVGRGATSEVLGSTERRAMGHPSIRSWPVIERLGDPRTDRSMTGARMKQEQQKQQRETTETVPARTTFVRDDVKTRVGFSTHECAREFADSMGPADDETRRVRVR